MENTPNRERWSGWVAAAWLLAILAIVGGIAVIATAGFVEVPRQNSFGRIERVTEPNVFIWAIAIGQAVSASMLAALFSMVNSIYKNTCDQVSSTKTAKTRSSKNTDHMDTELPAKGLRITNVKSGSPLTETLHTGCLLVSINDKPVNNANWADNLTKTGTNKLEFYPLSGNKQARYVELENESLQIEGEAANLPDQKASTQEGGLKVLSIHQASQLEGLLQPGFTLLEINEKPVATEMEAAKAVIDGENQIFLINNQGEKSKYSVNMKPGPLHIQFEA